MTEKKRRTNTELEVTGRAESFSIDFDAFDGTEEIEAALSQCMYQKANIFITAKFSASLMSNKIFNLALSDPRRMERYQGTIRAHLTRAEIIDAIVTANATTEEERDELLEKKRGSIYASIRKAADELGERKITIEDEATGAFEQHRIVQSVIWNTRDFYIVFNTTLANRGFIDRLVEKSSSYLSLNTILSFGGVHSLRLYELLRSKVEQYCISDKDEWIMEFDFYELLFLLGIANAEDPKAQEVFQKTKFHYSEAVNAILNGPNADKNMSRVYLRPSRFRSGVLKRAVQEINQKSEIYVSFTNGEKINDIPASYIFTCRDRKRQEALEREKAEKKMMQAKEQDRENLFQMQVRVFEALNDDKITELAKNGARRKFIPTLKKVERLIELADYDEELILRSIELMKRTPNVRSVMAWLTNCIRENWASEIYKSEAVKENETMTFEPKRTKKPAKTPGFNDFEQRVYDYDALEKILTSN